MAVLVEGFQYILLTLYRAYSIRLLVLLTAFVQDSVDILEFFLLMDFRKNPSGLRKVRTSPYPGGRPEINYLYINHYKFHRIRNS